MAEGNRDGSGRSDRSWARLVGPAVAVIVLLTFAFANRDRVEVDYVVFQSHSRLIYVILVSALLGAVAAWLFRLHRRRD